MMQLIITLWTVVILPLKCEKKAKQYESVLWMGRLVLPAVRKKLYFDSFSRKLCLEIRRNHLTWFKRDPVKKKSSFVEDN
jgi:hypothetical protein